MLDIENIKNLLSNINANNLNKIIKLVNEYIQGCLLKNENADHILSVLLELLSQQNQNILSVNCVISGFIQAYLSQNRNIKDIEPILLETLSKSNSRTKLYILSSLAKTFSRANPKIYKRALGFINKYISKNRFLYEKNIIQEDFQYLLPNLDERSINSCIGTLVKKHIPKTDIKTIILKSLYLAESSESIFNILNVGSKKLFSPCIKKQSEILEFLSKIKDHKLYSIARNFFISKLYKDSYIHSIKFFGKKYQIKKILPKLRNGFKEDVSTLFISPLIFNYIRNTLFTGKKPNIKTEKYILKMLKMTYPSMFNDVDDFKNIELSKLLNIWKTYFNKRILSGSINGGNLDEVLPFIFSNDTFKDKKISDLYNNSEISDNLENFKYINISTFKGKRALNSLVKETKKSDKTYIVYTTGAVKILGLIPVGGHAVVSVIHDGKIDFIDSSHAFLHPLLKWGTKISLVGCSKAPKENLNKLSYQRNGTCYLDAALTFNKLLKEQVKKQKMKKKLKFNDIKNMYSETKDNNFETVRGGNIDKYQLDITEESAKFFDILDQKQLSNKVNPLKSDTIQKTFDYLYKKTKELDKNTDEFKELFERLKKIGILLSKNDNKNLKRLEKLKYKTSNNSQEISTLYNR